MKKVLGFSFFPAFVPPSNGGEVRLFNFYRSLSRFCQVTLLSSGHVGAEEEVVEHGPNFIERRIPKDSYFVREWAQLQLVGSGGDLSGPCIAACGEYPTALHSAYLEEYERSDIIVHDSPFTADYDLYLGLDNKLRVYNSYNCETSLYQVLHPSKKSEPVHELIKKAELKLLSAVDCVLYCGDADLADFENMLPGVSAKALFAPNGMLAKPLREPKLVDDKKKSAVFIGSGHPPNVEAAKFIAETLAPKYPHIQFNILGNCLPEGSYPKNLIRHGFVSNVEKAQLLSTATIALNPMVSGSGSNVKIFDYLSVGIPLLSTVTGVRGVDLNDEDTYISASLDSFGDVLQGWIGRKVALQEIGHRGHSVTKEKFTWDAIVQEVASHLDTLLQAKCDSGKFVLVLNDYDSFGSIGGGATRTKGLYLAVQQWSKVIFICFSNDEKITVRDVESNITVIAVPKTMSHMSEQARVNSLFHVSSDDVIASEFCLSNTTLLMIYKALARSARSIVVEHPYMAVLPLASNDDFVYSSQNNEALLKARLLQYHPESDRLINRVATLERTAVQKATSVIAVSSDDASSLLEGVTTAGPMLVVRNGADKPAVCERSVFEKTRKTIKLSSAVFLGSAHMPNVDAARFIAEVLAPACPEIDFHIVGSVCNAIAAREQRNITLWGILDEDTKTAVMQSCAIAINPMMAGSGSNVKLADYLGNGLHVVTTEFGQRGYPAIVDAHVTTVELEDFPGATRDAVDRYYDENVEVKDQRKAIFDSHLSMTALAKDFVVHLKNLEVAKKRILFVTYRYVSPCLGGAESMIENLLRSLDASNAFSIDVVAPAVSGMSNDSRFAEHYQYDEAFGAFSELKNTRFARFPTLTRPAQELKDDLSRAWRSQPEFERRVYERLKSTTDRTCLAWGWSHAETNVDGGVFRWAFNACGLHLQADSQVILKGYAPEPLTLLIQDNDGCLLFNDNISGVFDLSINAQAGQIEILASRAKHAVPDIRPLAFMLTKLLVNSSALDLANSTAANVSGLDPAIAFDALGMAADEVRRPLSINLTDMRGPFSSELEAFIEHSVGEYDLVVTHNTIFRPAVIAVECAKKNNVPVIVIPHAHLDDDFYHFPDVLDSALKADLILAAPHAACDFYKRRGATARYLPAGIDTHERFSEDDVADFKDVYDCTVPFVLVLGRKAAAKGYQSVIDAVAAVNKVTPLNVVLIGPDDDGVAVDSSVAAYLGRQSRSVVRGALMSCTALVNMSTSESFGIVLLEAWLANKPVVVNRLCAAFHDMAIDEVNALMVDVSELEAAIMRIVVDKELQMKLAGSGRQGALAYDWKEVGARFTSECLGLIDV